MTPESVFYATFARVEEGIYQKQYHDWLYPLAFFETVGPDCGFRVEVMEDWRHPHEHQGEGFSIDTMLKLTPDRSPMGSET